MLWMTVIWPWLQACFRTPSRYKSGQQECKWVSAPISPLRSFLLLFTRYRHTSPFPLLPSASPFLPYCSPPLTELMFALIVTFNLSLPSVMYTQLSCAHFFITDLAIIVSMTVTSVTAVDLNVSIPACYSRETLPYVTWFMSNSTKDIFLYD